MTREEEDITRLYADHVAEMARRHDAALERAGADGIVIAAGEPRYAFLDDQTYPYVVNPDFNAWLPLTDAPGSYLVYQPGMRPQLAYCQPVDYWHMAPAEPAGYWPRHFDILPFDTPAGARSLLPDDLSRYVFLGEVIEPAQTLGIERINPPEVLRRLHYARSVKTGYELACLRAATYRAAGGHLAAHAAFESGASEFEIHLAYCEAAGQLDAELPYHNIVALNEHAAVLHYQRRDREPPPEIRSFLIDAGASHAGYAADITRSYASADRGFAGLITAMHELQQDIVADVRAGVEFPELHLATHRRLAGLLLAQEIASAGSAEALVEAGVTRAFLPHGLGHLLGLQVHDVGGFMADAVGDDVAPPPEHPHLRLTRTLAADQVLTIEPGLYFIDMRLEELHGSTAGRLVNWLRVEELKPFGGIRIEDNVRVVAVGVENMTRFAFASVAVV
ncbi:MAG: Xaa-Pro dipeptidase [Gammaproteobacteria bacterium]